MSIEGHVDSAWNEVDLFDGEGLDHRLIGELLEVVAHDLRNPLAALCSNLEFIRSLCQSLGPDVGEAIEDGIVSSDGLCHLASNLDQLGQALRRVAPNSNQPIRLRSIVSAAMEGCRAAVSSHGLELQLQEDSGGGDAVVAVCRLAATRAVSNLIRNSVQHAPAGSTVKLEIESEPQWGVVRVTDLGQALLPAHDRAFSAAGQVSQPDSRLHYRYSRGLGLFSARLGALACHGTVESAPLKGERGNVFQLRFPRPAPSAG